MSNQLKYQLTDNVPLASTTIKTGFGELAVRLAGCYITTCVLAGKPILYCDASIKATKNKR
jgi:hypothetical protein